MFIFFVLGRSNAVGPIEYCYSFRKTFEMISVENLSNYNLIQITNDQYKPGNN